MPSWFAMHSRNEIESARYIVHYRAFQDYDTCLKPIQKSCAAGVTKVYEIENEWHRIIEIARYLCIEGLQGTKGAKQSLLL